MAVSVAAATLPTLADLRARIAALPATVPPDLKQRLQDAAALIAAADRQRALPQQTTDTRQKILELEEYARRLLGIAIGSATFGRITGKLDTNGRLTARVEDADVRDILGPGFAVDRVHGTLEAGAGGIFGGGLTGTFGADATAEGVRTEFGTVGSVAIAGLRGDVAPKGDGVRLSKVVADRIAIGDVHLAGVTAKGVTIEGLGLDATLDPKASVVDRLDIRRLAGEEIVYDAGDVHAELKSGALLGIHVEHLDLAKQTGALTVGGVEDLRYAVTLGALSASGTLKADGAGPVISARAAVDPTGQRVYSLAVTDLDALATEVRTPDGSVRIRRVRIGTQVEVVGGKTTAKLHLRDLNLGRIRWKAGALRIAGDGTIRLGSVDVAATLDDHGLAIDDFDVRDVTASGLHVVNPPLDVHLGPSGLGIGRIRARGFTLPRRPDGTLGPPAGGHLDVQGLKVDFAGQITAALKAEGDISARELSVDLLRGGTLVARAQGLGANVTVDAGAVKGNVGLMDVDTGTLRFGPDGIVIDDLRVPMLTLDALKVATPALKLESESAGAIYVMGMRVQAHMDRDMKRIVLKRFEIDRIDAEGLRLELPAAGVVISVPVLYGADAPIATLRRIVLEGEKGSEGFIITPSGPDLLRGVARLDETVVPNLYAEVEKHFKGRVELSTGAASIGFLERGKQVIDIANPRAKMTDPGKLSSPDQTILVQELGAEKVHIADGEAKVTNAFVDQLAYEQPGIRLELEKLRAPGEVTASALGGHIPELALAGAHLHVNFGALPKGADDSGAGSGQLELGDLGPLLDSLQGDLSMRVFIAIHAGPLADRDIQIPVKLHFEDGRINFAQLQADLWQKIKVKVADEPDDTSHVIQALAGRPEFRFEGSDLVFGLHLFDIYNDETGMQQEATPVIQDLARWRLPSDEFSAAQKAQVVRVARLKSPVPDAKPKDPHEQETAMIDTLEFRDIDANLNVRSKNPIPLSFKSPTASGAIMFAPEALLGLKATGTIGGNHTPRSRWGMPVAEGLKAISLDQANVQSVNLVLGGTTVSTGRIEIRGLHDASVYMIGHKAYTFDARLTSASAKDIRWTIKP